MTSKYRANRRQLRNSSRRLSLGKVDALQNDASRIFSEIGVTDTPVEEPSQPRPAGFGIGIEEVVFGLLIYAGAAILAHVA